MALKNARDGATHSAENVQGIKLPMGSFELCNNLKSLRTMMERCATYEDHEEAHALADDLLCLVIYALLERTYDDERVEVKGILDAYEKIGKWCA